MNAPETSQQRIAPVYQLLAEDLQALGVDSVFGLMSDDICQLVATLDAIGVRFIGMRQETHAVIAAAGYAAASGKLGVALIGRGPATANAIHGATSAGRTGFPVLIITGEAPRSGDLVNAPGPDQKAFPGEAAFRLAGLQTFSPASPESARHALGEAVAAASRGRAAVLLLPTDIQIATAPVAGTMPVAAGRPAPAPARQAAVDAAVTLLKDCRRPLIVGGVGAHRAGARQVIEALAEKLGALLVTTLKAKDLFRGNPYDLGILGSSSSSAARSLVEQADCVLAFGAGLNVLTMTSGTALPPVPLIHVDTDRTHVGRYWHADVGVVGDARQVAEQLLAALPDRAAEQKAFRVEPVRAKLASFLHTQDFVPAHTARTVDPRLLTLELSRLLPEQRHVVFDGGNFMSVWAYVSVPDPGHFTHTQEFGSVGLGLGTALGVARARPQLTTVLFIGDGGLLMSMGELETVIREDLPVVVIVMNDAAYGAEVHILRGQNLPTSKAEFADVDFAPMAELLGFEAATVRSMDDLARLAPQLAKPTGPMLIDCKINVDVIAPFITEVMPKLAAHA